MSNSIHLLRSASAASDPDSLRLTIETFVARPADHPRAYRVQLEVFSPKPGGNRSARVLDVAVPILPPRGTRFTVAVPWTVFEPFRDRRPRSGPEFSHTPLVLTPNRLPEDSLLTDYPQGVRFGKEVNFDPPR